VKVLLGRTRADSSRPTGNAKFTMLALLGEFLQQ
jgi:hypothetical protein